MIERKRAGPPPPPSSAYPYNDGASQFSSEPQYGGQFDRQFDRDGNGSIYNGAPSMYGGGASMHQAPSAYGAPHPGGAAPIPYGGQNMYNQYSDRNYGAGYGAGAGVGAYGGPAPYAPYSQNPHHPHQQQQQQQFARGYPNYNGQQQPPQQYHNNFDHQQQHGQMGGNQASVSTPVTPTNQLSNPFAETSSRGPSPASGSSSSQSHGTQQSNGYMLRNASPAEEEDSAPPAYSDDSGKYADLQRDQKTPVVMSVEGASASSPAPSASAPAPAAAPTPAPAAAAAPKPEPKAGGARPISSQTVYDPNDAYGGM